MNDRNRSDDVSLDTVLEVLSNERRRLVLEYLLRRDESATVEELIDHVVAESRPVERRRPDDLRSRFGGRLRHVDLPKMDDTGLIEYDRARQVVSATDAAQVVEPYFELLRTDDSE